MQDIILHLGSNLGWRHRYLLSARSLLRKRLGEEMACSGCYETSAWGVEDQGAFLNIALHYQTPLTPLQALKTALEIENEIGRQRNQKWRARCIDIDLIFYGNVVMDTPQLTLPHPWMHARRFVLQPLSDIVPNWQHPILHQSVAQLLAACTDKGTVVSVY